jgi:hypothetical protein
MHLRLNVGVKELRDRALAIAREDKIWTSARPFVSEGASLQRIELTVGDATLAFKPAEVRALVERLVHDQKKSTKPSAKRATPAKRARR